MESENIKVILLNELNKSKEQHPGYFQKPVYVLEPVDDSIDNQWTERLQQAKNDKKGERIILITYHVGNCHWIGILLEFESDEQIKHAEFIDPVEKSNFDPNEIQRKFTNIFLNVILRSKILQKHSDLKQSAKLTIINLVEATKEYSNTDEYLNSIYKDFSTMPSSVERSVRALFFYLSVKKCNSVIKLPIQNFEISNEIAQELTNLGKRLQIEKVNSSEILGYFQEISVNIKNREWLSALQVLKKISRQIYPLDVPELFRLVEKTKEAAEVIKNKNIILFLGKTGAGKSTMIHYLAGSKMEKTTVSGLSHIAPVEIRNPDLQQVTTTPFSQSETRYIKPVRINCRDVGLHRHENILVCDTPGFGDTGGAEVDIANGIGMITAIKGCNTVKPVVLNSFKSMGDRCEGVKEIAHIIVGLIPGIAEHIKTFSFLFTKYPEDQVATIYPTICDIFEKLTDEEKSNESLTLFLEEMLDNTVENVKHINPLDGAPSRTLTDLQKSASIAHPDEVFYFSITEKSKSVLNEYVTKSRSVILTAKDSSEYDLIQYKLDQLKSLHELLDFDYIKQAYDECIEQIKNHLSGEFNRTTSKLNEAIQHETILNDENIQSYLLHIDQIKQAEQVRTTHLGQDVIQCSSYIQNVNQQIDRLINAIKEIDINNPLVKINLDKIKYLLNNFNNEHNQKKYEEICGKLGERIDCIVNEFQGLLQSNNFEQCANQLTKLFQAIECLTDHLNIENIKEKYDQLKDSSIKYLIDLTEDLNDIFDEKQIETTDIDKLIQYIGILDKANLLQPHVSKEKINQISEEFLQKILEYFKSLIEKIHEEKSFDLLKQYVDQLDLFQKIPIIQFRTASLYSRTLEELIGYITESGRIVDEQLRLLYRHDGTVDYDKLMKSLMNLKKAQWIKKYRARVYDDVVNDVVNDVEPKLIQHWKSLKDSLMEMSLNVEDVRQIDQAHEIILEINKMQSMDKIISNIVEETKEVKERFFEKITDVFDIIRNTFNIEQWKRQNYEPVDLNKLQNSLNYLDSCKKLRIMSDCNCMLVLNTLEEFIRFFSNHIHETILSRSFEMIKQFNGENKEEIFEKSRLFAKYLREISEIKCNYPRIYSYFLNKKLFEQWQDELTTYCAELADEMQKYTATRRIEILSQKLIIAKVLSKSDQFLSDCKYSEIYNEYQSKFCFETNDVTKNVFAAIGSRNYQQVAYQMALLQSSADVGQHFFREAKRTLTNGLEDLMEETTMLVIMLGSGIECDRIRTIVNNLRHLQRAKQYLSGCLGKTDDIDKCIEDVKKLIEEGITKFVESVKELLMVNNFAVTNKQLQSITSVRAILGVYTTESINAKFKELEQCEHDIILNRLVSKYSSMDLSSFSLNPPTEILDKLKPVIGINPIYLQAFDKIRENIFIKFREELQKAEQLMPPNVQNVHIRRFEAAINYIPQEMKRELENELKYCKDTIENIIRHDIANLNEALSSGDLKKIKQLLEEYEKRDLRPYLIQGKEIILQQIQDISLNIKSSFNKNDIVQAFEYIKKLCRYKIELGKIIIEIVEIHSNTCAQVKTIFDDAYNSFTTNFLNATLTIVSKELINTIRINFILLFEFMRFEYNNRESLDFIEILPNDFGNKTASLNENILTYFNDYQMKYYNSLEKFDFPSLKQSLDVASRWNELFIAMKKYDNVHHIKILTELLDYSQRIEIIWNKLTEIRDELIDQELLNTGLSQQRNEFYRKINDRFSIIIKAKSLSLHDRSMDINKLERQCLQSIEQKLHDMHKYLINLLDKFQPENGPTEFNYEYFNLYYNNLISFKFEIKIKDFQVQKRIDAIDDVLFIKIRIWERAVTTNSDNFQIIASNLIHLKYIAIQLPLFTVRINQLIDKSISSYKTNNKKSHEKFGRLGTILRQDTTGYGQRLIDEHEAFKGYALCLFNERISRHGVDYVIQKLNGDSSIDTTKLRKRYDEFRKIYEDLIQVHLKTKDRIEYDVIISQTKLVAKDIRQDTNKIQWTSIITSQIPRLTAHIFALWTLQNSSHYLEATTKDDSRDNYLFQPHAAQIISIFRMLGIGDVKEELKNNLVQIGTGEGKSITLAVTACILVLLGFDVRCACYSEYLSQRDYKAFTLLFDSLNLLKYIRYGTFNKLCEDMINENGDLRCIVEEFISKNPDKLTSCVQKKQRAKILLIDEVDVFFSKDFYGNIYTPTASLRGSTITSLVKYIWVHQKSQLTLSKIKATPEYKACCQRYSNWSLLIDESIKDMLHDINNFQSHQYIVNQDKIGYIEQDDIVCNVTYGYKTLFAYLYECDNGRISEESLNEHIYLHIKCGSFSYAEIPLKFVYIMGVTGTLETLSEPEKKVIESVYKMHKYTYIPSVFGQNNLQFIEKNDIKIENNDDYYNTIRREIDDRIQGKLTQKRAILVFFESKQKLKDFYNSKSMESIKDSVSYLTEEASREEKETLIKRSTVSGQITLFTKIFGRGTDFICHDQHVLANGGIHVIQTFLSEEYSEEVQIKGRTARQGEHGSYSMILFEQDLKKFQINKQNIKDVRRGINTTVTTNRFDTVYDLLNSKRIILFKAQYEENEKYVIQAKFRHDKAEKLLSSIHSGDIKSVRRLLIDENKGTEGTHTSRTICLMDATGSMSHLLHKCKTTVQVMFERASKILTDAKINPDSFEMQLAVYRNYNSEEEKILQVSPWETKADNLRSFMNTIEVQGGWSNEAIEIGLWHANKEYEREAITQVILIGDAPPNSPHDVTNKRQRLGESYWQNTKFGQLTHFENELAILIHKQVPVHAFYVDARAEQAFRNIATATNGRCEFLDINSSAGADMLTNLVTEVILKNVGGKDNGDKLVRKYREKFRVSAN